MNWVATQQTRSTKMHCTSESNNGKELIDQDQTASSKAPIRKQPPFLGHRKVKRGRRRETQAHRKQRKQAIKPTNHHFHLTNGQIVEERTEEEGGMVVFKQKEWIFSYLQKCQFFTWTNIPSWDRQKL